MFLALLYVTVFLEGTHAFRPQCPTPSQMLPCECQSGGFSLEVFCEGTSVDQIQRPLATIARTKEIVYNLSLQHVQLSYLPSNLLVGSDVHLIEIKKCNLSKVDENAFADVAANLAGLTITGNPMDEVPSHALENLSNLEFLSLQENIIQGLRDGSFKGLYSLIALNLNDNKIKFIEDFAFEGIGMEFKSLHLSRNELTSFPGKPLSILSSLEFLQIGDNKIISLDSRDFGAMESVALSSLILWNNRIPQLPVRVFKSLKKLSHLDLSGNVIESIHPLAFEGNEDTLNVLHVRHNQLEEVPTASLKNLSALQDIDLSGNNICKVRKEDFLLNVKNLKTIFLRNNSLNYVDPAAFIHLDTLRELSLQSNQLTSAPFETYSPVLDTLQSFDIHDNPLDCDCKLSWLLDWIRGNGSRIVQLISQTKCATPGRHANVSLAEVSSDELVCKNFTSTESCCNNGHERLGSGWFITLFRLSVAYVILAIGRSRMESADY